MYSNCYTVEYSHEALALARALLGRLGAQAAKLVENENTSHSGMDPGAYR